MAEATTAELGDELVGLAAALRRSVRRRLRRVMPGPPLRGAHVELLRIVEQQPGIGVAAAARALSLVPNTVSTLVNQLVEKEMLVREVDPADRRAARLRLTEPALARLAAWREARAQLVAGGVATLSAADRHALERSIPALRALVAAVERGDGV